MFPVNLTFTMLIVLRCQACQPLGTKKEKEVLSSAVRTNGTPVRTQTKRLDEAFKCGVKICSPAHVYFVLPGHERVPN